jgi:hypothetical protein
MASRHELSMDSYDRLFPSQDTMPRGGFGNLIALPLQHGPRQAGNSVFLDESLNAFADDQQWSVLASVQRIAPATVEQIASEATRAGTVVGVRIAETAEDAEEACELFPEWSPAKLDELFTSPLFVPKGESAVQLPDGAVTQCLAALWVVQRYRAELDLDAVVDAPSARVPGESGLRLPDSRRALVGWTASALPELRKTLRAIAPDALLHFGDPSKLSCREISDTIAALIARKTVRHWEWPTNGTLFRTLPAAGVGRAPGARSLRARRAAARRATEGQPQDRLSFSSQRLWGFFGNSRSVRVEGRGCMLNSANLGHDSLTR